MNVKVLLWGFAQGRERIVDIKLTEEHWRTEPIENALEEVFFYGQNEHDPQDLPSVSCGDVAELFGKLYLCCSVGWKELSNDGYDTYKMLSQIGRQMLCMRLTKSDPGCLTGSYIHSQTNEPSVYRTLRPLSEGARP